MEENINIDDETIEVTTEVSTTATAAALMGLGALTGILAMKGWEKVRDPLKQKFAAHKARRMEEDSTPEKVKKEK